MKKTLSIIAVISGLVLSGCSSFTNEDGTTSTLENSGLAEKANAKESSVVQKKAKTSFRSIQSIQGDEGIYRDKESGFEFIYPDGWIVQRKITDGGVTYGAIQSQGYEEIFNSVPLSATEVKHGAQMKVRVQKSPTAKTIKDLQKFHQLGNDGPTLNNERVIQVDGTGVLLYDFEEIAETKGHTFEFLQNNRWIIISMLYTNKGDIIDGREIFDYVVSTLQFSSPETTADWKTYRDTTTGFEFKYPEKLKLRNESGKITLQHSIPFENYGGCDMVDGSKLYKTLEDFHISIELVDKTLLMKDFKFAYVSDVGIKGFQVYEGVEGCGHVIYYFPFGEAKTIVIQKELVQSLSENGGWDREKILKVPGVITTVESEILFEKILSTFKPLISAPVPTTSPPTNDVSCITDFQKQEVASLPSSKFTLSKTELDNFKSIMGIQSFCLPKTLGPLLLNVDWDSKSPNASSGAGSGRMISLGFNNIFRGMFGGWGRGYMVYATYDFVIGSMYYTYATQADFQAVVEGKKDHMFTANGATGFIQYKWQRHLGAETGVIVKIAVFPFKNSYVAIVYELLGKDYTQNHEQVIAELYANKYPKEDAAFLRAIDDFVASIKFKDAGVTNTANTTANWETYKLNRFGIEIQFPNLWGVYADNFDYDEQAHILQVVSPSDTKRPEGTDFLGPVFQIRVPGESNSVAPTLITKTKAKDTGWIKSNVGQGVSREMVLQKDPQIFIYMRTSVSGLSNTAEKATLDKILSTIKINPPKVINNDFRSDADHVYYCNYDGCSVFFNADPKTFQVVLDGYFAKDKNQVYRYIFNPGSMGAYQWEVLEKIDVNSFEMLKHTYIYAGRSSIGNAYFKDKSHVYYNAGLFYTILKNIDVKSTTVIDSHVIKDKNGVYWGWPYEKESKEYEMKAIRNAKTKSFVSLENRYYKDAEQVYCTEGKSVEPGVITQADADTFKPLGEKSYLDKDLKLRITAEDKNHLYSECTVAKDV